MVALVAPYGLNYKRGDTTTADRSTGRLYSYQFIAIAGSYQNVAQVGSAFYGPSGTRLIRAEAVIDVGWFRVWTPAFFGYSSAEAILNLRIMNGSQVVAHDRRSLGRAIAAVFWNSEITARDLSITMATEFWGGSGRQYSAMVEVETWVGAGGPYAYATASCSAKVRQIDVRVL